MAYGLGMPYFGRRGSADTAILVNRRAFRPGLLAVVATSAIATTITLSDAVPAGNVAAVWRHLDEAHAVSDGVTVCRVPCAGALALLPTDEPARRPASANTG